MSTARQGAFRKFAARACAASLLVAALLFLSAPAQAALIGNTVGPPDIFISYLNVATTANQFYATSTMPYFDLLTATDDIFITGNYALSYDFALGTGSFSLTGSFEATLENFWMQGHVTRAGSTGDGKAYDFLVQLDAIDPALAAYGFGGAGATIYTDLLLNGQFWQSDTVSAPVPEPSTCLLLGAGLLLAAGWRRRLQ